MSADVCPWCAGGSRNSDWGPYCSGGCEYSAALAQARAEGEAAGRAAERAAVAAYLREIAVDADTTLDVCNVLLTLIGDIRRGDHIAAVDADSNNNAPKACP